MSGETYNPTSVKTVTGNTTVAQNQSNFSKALGYNTTSNQVAPNAFDKISYTNFDQPEYYRDKNLFLKDTITGFLFDAIEVYTTLILPWAVTDQHHIQWNEWRFDGALMGRVPHEGVPRLISSSKIQRRASVVRRGLAFVMEHDYLGTPEGDFQYAQNVMAIAHAIQETTAHDTIYTLLTCKDNTIRWQQMFGQTPLSFQQIFDQEIAEYACLVKGQDLNHYNQFQIIVQNYKDVLEKQGVKPDILLGDNRIPLYLAMGDPVKTQYWAAGPDGVAMLKEGPDAISNIRGIKFFSTPFFNVDTNSIAINLLSVPSMIGEYYEQSWTENRNQDNYNYTSKSRDIYVYNENKDDMEKIAMRKSVLHSKVWQKDNSVNPKLVTLVKRYNSDGRKEPNFNYSDGSSIDEDSAYERMMESSIDHPPPHFLATVNSNGKWELAKLFAQLPIWSATSFDFIQVAQSILGKVTGSRSEDRDTFLDLINFLKQIESQPYNREYWLELIKTNQKFSVNENDEFVGHMTPTRTNGDWGTNVPLREWTPNAYGGMALPPITPGMENVEFPAGFNNGPGIKTIAAEASKFNSPWQKLGERAARIEAIVNKIIAYCKEGLPTCHVLDPESQSPWFHLPDAFTTFIENVVSIQRDPIFLAKLPSVGAPSDGNQNSKVYGASARETNGSNDNIPWHVIPLFVSNPDDDTVASVQRIVDQSLKGGVQFSDESTNKYYSYTDPFTQQEVVIRGSYLTNSAILPVYVQAMSYMGQKSIVDLANMAGLISGAVPTSNFIFSSKVTPEVTKRTKLDRLAHLVIQIAQFDKTRARNFVIQVHNNYPDVDQIVSFIDEIYVMVSHPQGKKAKAAAKKVTDLIQQNAEYIDDDIEASFDPVQMANSSITRNNNNARMNNEDSDAIRGAMENLYWVSFELNEMLIAAGKPKQPLVLTDDITTANMDSLKYTDIGPAYVAKAAQFAAAYNNTIALMKKVMVDTTGSENGSKARNNALRNASNKFSRSSKNTGVGKFEFNVADDDDSLGSAAFYRSPLTMSLNLLESLAAEVLPLIRPSDPATGHTTPYDVYNGQHGGQLDPALWKRPNYATIDHLVNLKSKKDFKNLTFIAKHFTIDTNKSRQQQQPQKQQAQPQKRKSDSPSPSNNGKKTKMLPMDMFEKDSTMDSHDFDNDYTEDNYFSYTKQQQQQQRGTTNSKMEIGAHGIDSDSEDDTWNKDKLKRQGTTGKRLPFTNKPGFKFTPKYHELYNPVALYRFREAEKITDPLLRAVVMCVLCTPIGIRETLAMIDNNVHIPFNILLVRYFIEHDMSSMIMMKGGLETGANLFGNSNYIAGEDVGSKLIYGNFTCKMKPIVYKEKNVLIIPNVKPGGYRGGHNTDFIVNPANDIGRRDKERPSFIAMLEPITAKSYPTHLCATGKLPMQNYNQNIDGRKLWHFSTCEFYESIYQLGNRTDINSLATEDFISQCDRVNIMAQPGLKFDYNNTTHLYDRPREGKGHRGRNGSGRGAAATWNGSQLSLPVQNFSEYKLQ